MRRPSASLQSPLSFASACGENYAHSLVPPFQPRPASLGSRLDFRQLMIALVAVHMEIPGKALQEPLRVFRLPAGYRAFHRNYIIGEDSGSIPLISSSAGTLDSQPNAMIWMPWQ